MRPEITDSITTGDVLDFTNRRSRFGIRHFIIAKNPSSDVLFIYYS